MRTSTCGTCGKSGKSFETINPAPVLRAALGGTDENQICYGCALECITGDRAPEEGDFNSARIISGEMSEQEWRWLKEDLEAAEQGRSIREYEPPEYEPLEEYNDDDEIFGHECFEDDYEVLPSLDEYEDDHN